MRSSRSKDTMPQCSVLAAFMRCALTAELGHGCVDTASTIKRPARRYITMTMVPTRLLQW